MERSAAIKKPSLSSEAVLFEQFRLVAAQELTAAREQLAEANTRIASLLARVAELEPEVRSLQKQLERALAALPVQAREAIEEEVRGPSLLTRILERQPAWQDALVFLPGTLKVVRKANYAEPEVVMFALEALATAYPAMREGKMTREQWSELLKERLIEDRACVALRHANHALADPLYASYNGRRIMLDRHLCRGSSTDPRRCMRIYFFWDAKDKKVVIGHLPTHLPNRMTEKMGL